jgi:hypothetical protein
MSLYTYRDCPVSFFLAKALDLCLELFNFLVHIYGVPKELKSQ